MKFEIYHKEKLIEVYQNGECILHVKSSTNFFGFTTHRFYQNEKLILISTLFMIGVKKLISISYQNFFSPVLWKGLFFKNCMIVNEDRYTCTWHYFSRNCCTIYKNKSIVAEVTRRGSWRNWYLHKWNAPQIYLLEITDKSEQIGSSPIFSVIRFLIDLPYLNI